MTQLFSFINKFDFGGIIAGLDYGLHMYPHMKPWLAFLYKSKMKFLEHPYLHRQTNILVEGQLGSGKLCWMTFICWISDRSQTWTLKSWLLPSFPDTTASHCMDLKILIFIWIVTNTCSLRTWATVTKVSGTHIILCVYLFIWVSCVFICLFVWVVCWPSLPLPCWLLLSENW